MIVVAIIGILAAVATYMTKADACTQTGMGCISLNNEITATSQLAGLITQGNNGSLTYDDGDCSVTATIVAGGSVTCTFAANGAIASAAQCQSGAGLN